MTTNREKLVKPDFKKICKELNYEPKKRQKESAINVKKSRILYQGRGKGTL